MSFAGSLASKVESTIVAIPKTTSTSSTAARDEEVDARLHAAFASRRVPGVSSAAATTALSSTATTTTTTTAGGGGGIPSVSSGMTYQECQRIMLTSNPTNAVTGGPSTLVSAAPTMARNQDEIRDFKATLPTIIKNAIEDKATESGQVTATFVTDRLNEAFKGVTKKLGRGY